MQTIQDLKKVSELKNELKDLNELTYNKDQ